MQWTFFPKLRTLSMNEQNEVINITKMLKDEFVAKFIADQADRKRANARIADEYHLAAVGRQRTKQRRMRKQRMAR